MAVHPLAGQVAPYDSLINVPRLISAYYTLQPDPANPLHQVAFGQRAPRLITNQSFNEAHILAISQAICEYRKAQGTSGPLYLGMDTHALSEPAQASALEVFARVKEARRGDFVVDRGGARVQFTVTDR
jgi:phosphoglucomutase